MVSKHHGSRSSPHQAGAAAPSDSHHGGKHKSAVDVKTQRVEKQVEEVIDIMEDNVQQMRERGDNLETLQASCESLEQDAAVFKKQTKEVQRKLWWKSHKMTFLIVVVVLIVIAAIAGKSVSLCIIQQDISLMSMCSAHCHELQVIASDTEIDKRNSKATCTARSVTCGRCCRVAAWLSRREFATQRRRAAKIARHRFFLLSRHSTLDKISTNRIESD